METTKIRVKLFGESFKIHRLNIKKHPNGTPSFLDIAKQLNEPLESALLHINYFNLLNKKYKFKGLISVQDLVDSTFGGLVNTYKGQIEIRKGRKCLQKIHLDELFNPSTLFPLFNVHTRNLKLILNNSLFLIEKEIGLISAYELETEYFDIYKLKFNICDLSYNNENHQLLLELSYNEKKLKSIKSDTLITRQYCVSHINQT